MYWEMERGCLSLQAYAGVELQVLKATPRVLSLGKSKSSQQAQLLTDAWLWGQWRWQSCWWVTLTPSPPLCHQHVQILFRAVMCILALSVSVGHVTQLWPMRCEVRPWPGANGPVLMGD